MPHVTLASSPADLLPGPSVVALLFDWDGTLFDNHDANFRALQHGLRESGVDITAEWFHRNSGFSASGMVVEAARVAGIRVDSERVLDDRDAFADAHLGEAAPVAAVHRVLMHPGGRRVGVVTGSNRSNIDGLLRLHGLEERLDALVTRDELQRGKPDPEGYLLAMRRLGVRDASAVLVYEDSEQGIAAALAAGADVVDVRPLVASSS